MVDTSRPTNTTRPAKSRSSPPEGKYPARRPWFAPAYQRLLLRKEIARHLGPWHYALLAAVVFHEHEQSYRRPIRFFNDHLQRLIGAGKEHKLIAVRKACVEEEWLVYRRKHRGAGEYWVTVPERDRDEFEKLLCNEESTMTRRPETPPQDGGVWLPNQPVKRAAHLKKNNNNKQTVFSNPGSEDSGDAKSEPRFDFETRAWEGITEADRAMWEKAFPALAIDGELCRMAAWIYSNRSRWDPESGHRFIFTWFDKAHQGIDPASAPERLRRRPPTAARPCAPETASYPSPEQIRKMPQQVRRPLV